MIIFLVLAFTNPSKDQYIGWAKSNLASKTNDGVKRLAISLLGSSVLDKTTQRNNLLIASVYTTSLANKEVIVVGVLGNFILISSNLSKASSSNLTPQKFVVSQI
jgi:hypothetical protein